LSGLAFWENKRTTLLPFSVLVIFQLHHNSRLAGGGHHRYFSAFSIFMFLPLTFSIVTRVDCEGKSNYERSHGLAPLSPLFVVCHSANRFSSSTSLLYFILLPHSTTHQPRTHHTTSLTRTLPLTITFIGLMLSTVGLYTHTSILLTFYQN
jgi:hypothetical protein